MFRLLTTTLAALALALSATEAGAQLEPRQGPGSWPHLEEVHEVFLQPDSSEAQRQLTALGANAAPAVWAMLSGRARVEDLDFDSGSCRELARKSIAHWDATEVIAALVSADEAQTPLGERLVLVEMLAWTDRSEALPAIFEILGQLDGIQQQSQRVTSQLERALGELLQGNPRRYRRLDKHVKDLPHPFLKPVITVAGRSASAEAASFLSRVAEESPFAERLVLEGLARRSVAKSEWIPASFLPIARRALDQKDLLSRRLGLRALGNLRDSDSFLRVVEVLEREEGSLRRTALAALQEMSGMRRDWDAGRWRTWLETEKDRFESHNESARSIHAADPGEALVAIRNLSTHRLFSRRAVEAMALALRHADSTVRTLACSALSELKHTLAINFLVERLDDPNKAVRATAYASLQKLSGRDFGTERLAWENWLRGLS